MTEHVIVEQDAGHPGIQIIRFNRPEKKNAITRAMYRKMADALSAANGDTGIRATVFLGSNLLHQILAFQPSQYFGNGRSCAFECVVRIARPPTFEREYEIFLKTSPGSGATRSRVRSKRRLCSW